MKKTIEGTTKYKSSFEILERLPSAYQSYKQTAVSNIHNYFKIEDKYL